MTSRPGKMGNLLTVLSMLMLAAAVAPGCATLFLSSDSKKDLSQQVDDQPVRGEVIVELKNARGSRFLKSPLKGTMLVEDALRGSGALREFNRMKVVVVRRLPNGKKLRMPVKMDADMRHVNSATNFALYPDDVVEVTEDPRTMFDRLIDSALSNLGPLAHDYHLE